MVGESGEVSARSSADLIRKARPPTSFAWAKRDRDMPVRTRERERGLREEGEREAAESASSSC